MMLIGIGDEGDELRIEDPEGPASIIVPKTENGQTGGMVWEGTLADLAAVASRPGKGVSG